MQKHRYTDTHKRYIKKKGRGREKKEISLNRCPFYMFYKGKKNELWKEEKRNLSEDLLRLLDEARGLAMNNA